MKKIVTVILLTAFVSTGIFFPTQKSQALWPVFDPISKAMDVISQGLQHVTILSLGLPGSGAAVQGAVSSAEEGCKVSDRAQKIVSVADNNVGIAVLAGDAAQIAKLSTKIATLSAISTCYQTVLAMVDNPATAAAGNQALDVLGGNRVALTQLITSFDQRIDALVTQRDAAVQKMWAGVAYRILMNVQQKITTQLLNKVVAQYKISDFSRYSDAVATQVYNTSYIQSHYPDQTDQLMLRSVMGSDLTQGQVLPMVRKQASDALGFVPTELDVNSPDYFVKLATAGAAQTNPYYMQTMLEDKAGQVKAQGAASARQEVAQGQGFIPARNCSSVVAQQNTVLAQQRQNAVKDLQVKMTAQSKLQAAQLVDPNSVKVQDLTAAAQAVAQANDAVKNVSASPEAKVCQDIVNPAAAINSQLSSYLQSSLNVTNAPKSQNLPFFANFVESVADNFLNGIITGGHSVSTSQLLTEGGFKAAAIATSDVIAGTAASQALKSADTSSQNQTGIISAVPDSVNGKYLISWDVSAIPGADHVILSAGGPSTSYKLLTNNRVSISAVPGTVVTLKVIDISNAVLTTLSATLPNATPGSLILPPPATLPPDNVPPDPALTDPTINVIVNCTNSQTGSPCNSTGTVHGVTAQKTGVPVRSEVRQSVRGD